MVSNRTANRASWSASCLVLLVASLAWGQEARVEVVAEVVHASDSGSAVEPASLARMKDVFGRSGIHYKSYRRLSREKLTLKKGQVVSLKLPNGHDATLTLQDVHEGSARVQVGVAPVQTVYTLGREGSVFIQAGPHNGGMLILVLSPVQK